MLAQSRSSTSQAMNARVLDRQMARGGLRCGSVPAPGLGGNVDQLAISWWLRSGRAGDTFARLRLEAHQMGSLILRNTLLSA